MLWERARQAARRGESFSAYRDALIASTLFDRLGERDFETITRTQAASSLTRLGRPAEAWTLHQQNFEAAARSGSVRLQESTLHAAFQDEIFSGRYDVAASLGDVLLSLPSDNAILRFDTLLWRSVLDSKHPAQRIADARVAAQRIRDEALRFDAEQQSNLAEGMFLAKSNPRRAIPLLDNAIAYNVESGRLTRAREAYVERARAYGQLNDDRSAERDLSAALSIRERQREGIERADLRDTFFGSAEEACRGLVTIYSGRGSTEEAFAAAESCRGRSLRDRAANVAGLNQVVRVLPAHTTMVHYTVLDDAIFIVVLRANGHRSYRSRVSRTQITKEIEGLEEAVGDGDSSATASITHQLSAHLLPFISNGVTDGDRLIFVPDEPLTRAPFALLDHPVTGKPLIVSNPIVIATSATGYVTRMDRRTSGFQRVLAIGDPAIDPSSVGLPRLPEAAREAEQVSAIYRDAVTLIGADATIERVTREFGAADVVNVGTHAVVSSVDALSSGLLLAPDATNDGVLYLRSLFELKLDRSPLVVLTGCSTAAAGGGVGQIRSLAHGFLAAGSRAVVASLWDVDDSAARAVSIGFHRRLAAGRAAAAALRETQISLSTSNDPRLRSPAAWAGFQLIGCD